MFDRSGNNSLTAVRAGTGAVAIVAGLCALSLLDLAAAPAPAPAPGGDAVVRADPSHLHAFAEHRYRIIGKLRLALFWISRDDVGSARMTWQSDGAGTAVALLVGSDPERAPRSLNQWGYLREEIHADRADVFSLRSLDHDESAPQAPMSVGAGPLFGVTCSSMKDRDVSSSATTVNGGGATYRMFDRLLDHVAVSPVWTARRAARPAGADPGFLTALQHVIRAGDGRTAANQAPQPVTYVYNNTIYDLSVRGRHRLGRTTIGSRTFPDLIRTDFSIRNRTTSDISRFGVTHAPEQDGVPLPVQIFYQPTFWLRVELRLDDEADAPNDPAKNGEVLARIRSICDTAALRSSNRH